MRETILVLVFTEFSEISEQNNIMFKTELLYLNLPSFVQETTTLP